MCAHWPFLPEGMFVFLLLQVLDLLSKWGNSATPKTALGLAGCMPINYMLYHQYLVFSFFLIFSFFWFLCLISYCKALCLRILALAQWISSTFSGKKLGILRILESFCTELCQDWLQVFNSRLNRWPAHSPTTLDHSFSPTIIKLSSILVSWALLEGLQVIQLGCSHRKKPAVWILKNGASLHHQVIP